MGFPLGPSTAPPVSVQAENPGLFCLVRLMCIRYSVFKVPSQKTWLPEKISESWRQRDSNSRPPPCKGGALPTELCPPVNATRSTLLDPREAGFHKIQMGLSGLEPPTSRLSGVRSNQLSYKPIRLNTGYSGCKPEYMSIPHYYTEITLNPLAPSCSPMQSPA